MSANGGQPSIISARNLTITFGHGADAVQAVRGIDFDVPAGTCFGIVGESGSGKSTILRALSGLNLDWTGDVTIDGRDRTHIGRRAFYRLLQMVFQDPYGSLHPKRTIDSTLGEPLYIHGIGGRGERIERVLREVGLDSSFRFRYPHQISGGQRQRVAIARALILEPKILLLDEPTSSLDVSVQAEILNLLDSLRRDRGLTYVLVTHNLAVVSQMCDQLVVMNRGRIVEEMGVEALMEGRTSHPYTSQLLEASRGYDREAARELKTFD
ncbi:MAG: ABC transporter ATP-binding protein [Azospirillaceae bacterium]